MISLPRVLVPLLLATALGLPAAAQTVTPAAPLAATPTLPVEVGTPKPAGAEAPAAAPKAAAALNETQQFCQNIAAAAADARFAWQRKQLNDLDAQLKQRIADLQAREAAYREVLAHREEVMKRAADTVVGIYAKMKPDAAALQLAALDDEAASAILAQLTQKQASTILNEIPPERAARMVTAITTSVGAGKRS